MKLFPWLRRLFGNRSESAATAFLKKLGYRILARNFRCEIGELDIVALDGKVIVFVEVRSTQDKDLDRPAESVNRAKQRRLSQLANYFLMRHKLLDQAARFDVLTVSWPKEAKAPTIVHFVNAFEAVD